MLSMIIKPVEVFDLQLFAEGGAGDSGTSAATGIAGQSEAQTSGASTVTGDNTNAADSAEGEVPSRAEQYKKFRNDYKQEFDADVQKAIRGRLKSANDFKGKVNPIIEMLSEKYGCKADDLDALAKAVTEDESFYEEEALKAGMSVAQFKQFKTLERENRAFKEAAEAKQQQEQEQHIWNALQEEAAAVKAMYADFDLEAELKNTAFSKLLKANIPMQTAYEVVHKNEIIPAAMQAASQKTAQKIANAVAANKARPSENGLSSRAAAVTRTDISKLTPKQMEEFKARARRGERITFKE